MLFDITSLSQFIQSFAILKLAFLIIIALYIIFALVVVQQIASLNRLVKQVTFSTVLYIIGWIHFLAAISLFFLALAIL